MVMCCIYCMLLLQCARVITKIGWARAVCVLRAATRAQLQQKRAKGTRLAVR